ncbi:MAG: DDE-type integrase/transposase/recombinase [Acidobacteria bacterium]|nr:DDE-type integrase/transposase/recombinase [Acidobacteriota bacterium]
MHVRFGERVRETGGSDAARRPYSTRPTIPTALGFWVSWLPFTLPQVWPFCWWVAVAVDHFSRRIMRFAVYRKSPSSASVRGFLETAFRKAATWPASLISDQGTQFTEKGFRRWCRRRGIEHRFGAVGKYGSLAVIERGIRTIKSECTRRLCVVPFRLAAFEQELALYFSWYNGHRPHSWLRGATPDEIYHRRRQAIRAPRFEPRRRWPRDLDAQLLKPSSAAGLESGSTCRSNSSPSAGIFQSSL